MDGQATSRVMVALRINSEKRELNCGSPLHIFKFNQPSVQLCTRVLEDYPIDLKVHI